MSNCFLLEEKQMESKTKYKQLHSHGICVKIPINWNLINLHITINRISYDGLNDEEVKKIIREMNDGYYIND